MYFMYVNIYSTNFWLRAEACFEYSSLIGVNIVIFKNHRLHLMHLDNFQFQFLKVVQILRHIFKATQTNVFQIFFFSSKTSSRLLPCFTLFCSWLATPYSIAIFNSLLPILCKTFNLVLSVTIILLITSVIKISPNSIIPVTSLKWCKWVGSKHSQISVSMKLTWGKPERVALMPTPFVPPLLMCSGISQDVLLGEWREFFNLSKSVLWWPSERGYAILWPFEISSNLELPFVWSCGYSFAWLPIIRTKISQGYVYLPGSYFQLTLYPNALFRFSGLLILCLFFSYLFNSSAFLTQSAPPPTFTFTFLPVVKG